VSDPRSDDVERALSEYLQTAIEWDAAANDAPRANKLFARSHRLYKQLRDSEAGRAGIASLMNDSCVGVRLLTATDSLAWSEAEAVATLEEIEQTPGLHAVSAKYTLKSYRDGTLNLDW
jgi:hypothetical protein